MTYYFDMDGVLANFHKDYDSKRRFQTVMNRKWIANLEPFMNNVNVVKNLIHNGEKVYILSKAACENARDGKLDWLKKWLPELDAKNIIIIIKSGRKVDYIKEDGILVDDDIKNCRPWGKAGHEYILLETKGQTVVI